MHKNLEELYDKQFLKRFWEFVTERQDIYWRRFVAKQPPPWTEDTVFQEVFFANVYRELDKGTIYLLENVINIPKPLSPEKEFFELLVYRIFNNQWTYEKLKEVRQLGDWSDWNGIAKFLHSYAAASTPFPVFTRAHMMTSIRYGGFPKKIDNISFMLNTHWKNLDSLYESYNNCEHMEQGFELVRSLMGYGSFLAYEIITDCTYSPRLNHNLKFHEDAFVNPGPGCKRGIELIVPKDVMQENRVNYVRVMEDLRWNQDYYFRKFNLEFKFIGNKSLTLRNIEHSLCEFSKYNRYLTTGKARRLYSPKRIPNENRIC